MNPNHHSSSILFNFFIPLAAAADFVYRGPRAGIPPAATLASNLLSRFSAVPCTTFAKFCGCGDSLLTSANGVVALISYSSLPSEN